MPGSSGVSCSASGWGRSWICPLPTPRCASSTRTPTRRVRRRSPRACASCRAARASATAPTSLPGSCAQIGKRVHLSAAAQVGGVLEPVGALPVVVEDDVLVGGGCGIFEGAVVRGRAVLAPGTILTAATPVHDLVREQVYRRDGERPLEIPAGAVVVPGSRTANGAAAGRWGISLYTPVIIKYRDATTDAATLLEEHLR